MPIDLFRRRSVRVATILGFLTGVAMTVVLTYGPTFVQLALGCQRRRSRGSC